MARQRRYRSIPTSSASIWEAGMADPAPRRNDAPIIEIDDLHVYYGHAHALQGVSLRLDRGVLGVVGRNGMGKTTLCNAVLGLVPASAGSIRLSGTEILGLAPNEIVNLGVGYVPQGRRVWPSLSVDEHLRLASRTANGAWTVERIYQTFPRLAERKRNGGAQLSGGEQQMLAISRALLANPQLLVMDEPTEGLAPVIVDQFIDMLRHLAEEGDISVLLIEQNLGVATTVAGNVAVMVNGRVLRVMPAQALAADHELQQRLLGVRTHEEEQGESAPPAAEEEPPSNMVFHVRRRSGEEGEMPPPEPVVRVTRAPTMWSLGDPLRARASEAEIAEAEVAPSIPRAANSPSSRTAWSGWVCAPSPLTSAPASARRPPMWGPARWPDFIPRAVLPSSPPTAALRSPPWQKRSSASYRRGAIWAGSSPPAARAARHSPRLPCADCRSVCPRSWCPPWPRATSRITSGRRISA